MEEPIVISRIVSSSLDGETIYVNCSLNEVMALYGIISSESQLNLCSVISGTFVLTRIWSLHLCHKAVGINLNAIANFTIDFKLANSFRQLLNDLLANISLWSSQLSQTSL